jgi:putative addiction module component (TIGR02574 family)
MPFPFDIRRLTPRERIELAERLWDSLEEEDIELTSAQLQELEHRRERLERDGPRGRPWREVFDEGDKRAG